ncbi:hypothetical protein RB195_022437 [Necator americanus]|uniref:Uncharacterized protein n=1 Tax=Necator americanus TaxID=51031 RepID=A0ABR1EFA7_NECAM
MLDMAGLKDEECGMKLRKIPFMLDCEPGGSFLMQFLHKVHPERCMGAPGSLTAEEVYLHLRKQNACIILYASPAALEISARKSKREGSYVVSCNNIAKTDGYQE